MAAACAAVIAPLALAQQSVVVTAAREPQLLADALPHTTVISRLEIERSQALDLAALLAAEAGLQLSANGGRGTATTLFVRGAPQRQVLVLVDGVALSRQDASGQVGIEHLMLDQVERIEIVRGNVSALYGSGAVGGVIQVFTRQGGATGGSASVEGGARGLRHAAAQATLGSGATRLTLGLAEVRERGISVLDNTQVPQANPDRDGYRNTSASLKLAHDWAAGHSLAASVWHILGRLDFDSAFATAADVQTSRTRKTVSQVASHNRLSEAWTSRLVLSRQTDNTRYAETGEFGFNGRFLTSTDGLAWSNQFDLGRGLRLQAGWDRQVQRADTDDGFGGRYDRSRSAWAAYASLLARLGAHDLEAALRRDRIEGIDAHTSGSLRWGWQVGPQWKVFGGLGNAFAAPPLGYLYDPFSGNPALRPERSRSAELGGQWSAAGQLLRATAFATRVEDEIDFDTTRFVFANLVRTRNRGLEVSYSGRIGATDLRASLTAQRPREDASGRQRLRRSESLASLSASHELGGGWRIGLAARHAGARPDIGGVDLPAYTVADLSAQWELARGWQAFGRIENLGDVRYQTAFGYNQPRRGLFVGLRWNAAG